MSAARVPTTRRALLAGAAALAIAPVAIVVINGLISSTLLTLVMLPAIYRWFDDVEVERA